MNFIALGRAIGLDHLQCPDLPDSLDARSPSARLPSRCFASTRNKAVSQNLSP